ncbi:transposase [Streptococcus pneumoniae]|nr:transposase [Streptococcus pneumoniae]
MSFIAQDFEKLDIITVLEGRTQAVIRDHFLKYDRAVRCRVKIITYESCACPNHESVSSKIP